jgi:hypothetical protein
VAKKKKKPENVRKAKKAKKVAVAPATIEESDAEIIPASFKLAVNSSEDRFPASDGVHDILHRKIGGRDVWKIVPKGGSWEDA